MDESFPGALSYLHDIRKHKGKVEVSVETLSCIWGKTHRPYFLKRRKETLFKRILRKEVFQNVLANFQKMHGRNIYEL